MKKIDYGVDAPNIIRNFFIVGIALAILVFLLPFLTHSAYLPWLWGTAVEGAIVFIVIASLMLLYSKKGKFKHRDRMLNLINWTGNETVLDIGTGQGLLMNGAAKHLTSGKAIGIDIWNSEDLSNNTAEKAMSNAQAEGVADKIEIRNENICSTTFKDESFDIILSNLCLHNISDKEARQKACREIYRILKPKGTALISDFKLIKEYANEFQKSGLTTEKIVTNYFSTFPPLTIIKAVKN